MSFLNNSRKPYDIYFININFKILSKINIKNCNFYSIFGGISVFLQGSSNITFENSYFIGANDKSNLETGILINEGIFTLIKNCNFSKYSGNAVQILTQTLSIQVIFISMKAIL